MSRTAKQLGYGTFYLAIIAFVAVSVFSGWEQEGEVSVPVPEGVRSLEVREAVAFMTAADGSVALLGRVWNPNTMYAASAFPYAFRIMRGDTVILETPRRAGFAYPLESGTFLETVLAETFIPTTSRIRDGEAIGTENTKVVLDIGAPTWVSAEFLVRPTLTALRVETFSDEFGAFIEGEVRNVGAVLATTARIIAIIEDMNGFPLFAAQTLLENIPGGTFRPFFIRFPRDRRLAERVAPNGTELIIEAQ